MDAVQGPFAITEGRGGYPLQAGASGGEEEEKAREAREMREPEAAVTTSGGPRSAGRADEARTWHGGAAPRTLELESSLVPPDVWRPSPARTRHSQPEAADLHKGSRLHCVYLCSALQRSRNISGLFIKRASRWISLLVARPHSVPTGVSLRRSML